MKIKVIINDGEPVEVVGVRVIGRGRDEVVRHVIRTFGWTISVEDRNIGMKREPATAQARRQRLTCQH